MEEKDLRAEIAANVFGEDENVVFTEVEETAEAEEAPEVVEAEEVIEDVEPEPVIDPWAGVAPALRETIEGLSVELKRTVGRVGSIQSEMQVARNQASKMANAPSPQELKDAAKSEEKWAELKEEFPDWAEGIESKLAANRADMLKDIPDLKAIRAAVADELRGEFDLKLVTVAHKDWKQVVKTPEYNSWLATQPQHVKDKHFSPDPFNAISLLDDYKASKPVKTAAAIKEQRKANLEKAARVDKQTTTTKQKAEADMTDAELRKKIAAEVFNE